MSDREKEIIQVVAEALPSMSEMDKGYFLGYAEALASKKDHQGKEHKEKPQKAKESDDV